MVDGASGRVEFYKHTLGDDEAAAFRRVLGTLFLTLGPEVREFERELGEFFARGRATPAPHVVGTNSCSMGLLITLRALGVRPGDEVITTPMTFASTANAILHLGAVPKLVDVEPTTGLISPSAVLAAIGPKTVGVVPVHLYGQMADMRALAKITGARGLFLVEDSAHGIEMSRDDVRPAELSHAAVFSFYATKTLTSGDGGAVATRDPVLAERLRRLRNHGVSRGAAERHGSDYQHWDLVELGYKANLTDLDAALLRVQLPRVMDQRAARERLARRYEARLREALPSEDVHSPSDVGTFVEHVGTSSHHLFTLHAKAACRDRILSALGAAQIGTAVNYRAIHTLSYLRDILGLSRGAFPVAEEIGDRTLSLPLYPQLTEQDQDRVLAAVVSSWPKP